MGEFHVTNAEYKRYKDDFKDGYCEIKLRQYVLQGLHAKTNKL